MWTTRKVTVAIGDSKGAGGAARYSLEPAASPLAFAPAGGGAVEPQSLAYWLGSERALGQLGLEPGQAVTQEQLELALQGRAMDGAQVRRPGWIHKAARDGNGRPLRDEDGEPLIEKRLGAASYDLTFSAPKSVSVVWSQAGAELRGQIEQAMLEAWNVATEHLVRSHDVVMQGRKGGGRKYGPARGFAASASLHATARRAKGDPAPAPQLHVHGMLVGLERDDGMLAAINSSVFFGDAALEAGAYARALLAERLSEMGFTIESGTGQDGLYFEIAEVPPELIEAMSGRTREIEAEAKRLEGDLERELTNREKAVLAMVTRIEKEGSASPEQVSEWWQAVAEEQGLGPEEIPGLIAAPGYDLDPERARADLAAAVERCMRKRGPTVTRAAARAIVAAAAPGRMSLEQAEEMIAELQQSGALLALEEGRVTSPSIRAEERKVAAAMTRAGEREREPLSPQAREAGERFANRALGKHRLDDEQVEAIAKLSQGSGWSVLTGRAGTGKTPVLQAVAEGHRQDGWNVVTCAIDWGTARELKAAVGGEALSIRQLLVQAEEGRLGVDDRTLILIDEAGKVGLEQWLGLAKLVDKTEARLVAVGHAGQIGAIELPGMFEEMVRNPEAVEVAELREIRRHKHEWMRDLQVAIDHGKGKDAVKILRREKAITLFDTREEAREAMVERWFAYQREHGVEQTAMIVQGSNEDVDAVNALAQAERLRDGALRGEAVSAPGRDYGFYAGDEVVLRGAAYAFEPDADGVRQQPVQNGTRGRVVSVDPGKRLMRVELREPGVEQPRTVEIDLDQRFLTPEGGREPSWRLGYALHPNPAQGLTIKAVFHQGGHWSQDQESSYVALSRQIEELHDFIDRESLRGESVKECYEAYARKLGGSRRRAASIRFEETPELKIRGDRAAGRRLPGEVDPGRKRPARRQRELAERLDPLAAHRAVLGEQRTARIERRADRYRSAVGRMHPEMLRAERASAREAFAGLDREGALRTLGLERDRAALEEQAAKALRHAQTLERQAKRLRGREKRAEQAALREVAATQRGLVEDDRARHEALGEQEAELRRQGVHPDQWLRAEGDAAARYVALERELFKRRERELAAGIEEAISEPPEDLVAQLGPAPEPGAPQRQEWEELAWELESQRLVAEGELPGAEPSAVEARELARRVERLREAQGLGPGPGPGFGREG